MVFDPTKAGKTFCACGNPAETFGGQCDRCASLQMLGLGMHATSEEIEGAYLTLVKVWHPDRFPTDHSLRTAAEDKLKEINAAHDFLVSSPQPAAQPDSHEIPQKAPTPRPFQLDPDDEKSAEVERILRRQKRSVVPGIMLKAGFAIGAVAVIAIIWFAADAILSSTPATQRWWEDAKTDLVRQLSSSKARMASGSDKPQDSSAESTPAPQTAAVPAPPTTEPKTGTAQKSGGAQMRSVAHVNGARPYVTSGLTPMEVLSALGKPTASTGEKMFYGSSEIDFKNGQVAGWKIDPRAPIRVKLWPDSAPVPGMTTFGAGSSKSDVIALQGTPTLFSDNEFGYGNSFVFFKNNRVVSWKEDPGSVRLRVPH